MHAKSPLIRDFLEVKWSLSPAEALARGRGWLESHLDVEVANWTWKWPTDLVERKVEHDKVPAVDRDVDSVLVGEIRAPGLNVGS